jgi:hypothetical protein
MVTATLMADVHLKNTGSLAMAVPRAAGEGWRVRRTEYIREVTKAQFIDALSLTLAGSKQESERILDPVLETVAGALQ